MENCFSTDIRGGEMKEMIQEEKEEEDREEEEEEAIVESGKEGKHEEKGKDIFFREIIKDQENQQANQDRHYFNETKEEDEYDFDENSISSSNSLERENYKPSNDDWSSRNRRYIQNGFCDCLYSTWINIVCGSLVMMFILLHPDEPAPKKSVEVIQAEQALAHYEECKKGNIWTHLFGIQPTMGDPPIPPSETPVSPYSIFLDSRVENYLDEEDEIAETSNWVNKPRPRRRNEQGHNQTFRRKNRRKFKKESQVYSLSKKLIHDSFFFYLSIQSLLEEVFDEIESYFQILFDVYVYLINSEEHYELEKTVLELERAVNYNSLVTERQLKREWIVERILELPYYDEELCWWKVEDDDVYNHNSIDKLGDTSNKFAPPSIHNGEKDRKGDSITSSDDLKSQNINDANGVEISFKTKEKGKEGKSKKKYSREKLKGKKNYPSIFDGVLTSGNGVMSHTLSDVIDLTRLDSIEAARSILQSTSLDEMHQLLEEWSIGGDKKLVKSSSDNEDQDKSETKQDSRPSTGEGNMVLTSITPSLHSSLSHMEGSEQELRQDDNIEKGTSNSPHVTEQVREHPNVTGRKKESLSPPKNSNGWICEASEAALYLSSSYCSSNTSSITKCHPGLQESNESSPHCECQCNIDRFAIEHFSVEKFNKYYRNNRPVIIEGAMNLWPAMESWSKDNLIKKYGNRLLKVGSGNEIVSSGGGYGVSSLTFEEYLHSLNKTISSSGETFPGFTSSYIAANEANTINGTNINDNDDSRESLEERDSFSFDTTFANYIPELLGDFAVPPYFRSFASPGHVKRHSSWYMLSIGGSKQGLPFHTHGETWLGVVNGQKRWFIYPPGKGLQKVIRKNAIIHSDNNDDGNGIEVAKAQEGDITKTKSDSTMSKNSQSLLNYSIWPLLSVFEWFQLIYPTLPSLTPELSMARIKKNIKTKKRENKNKIEHRNEDENENKEGGEQGPCVDDWRTHPQDMLECIQGRGDILYLPAGWKHMTLNIGETIAVGGQAAYGADNRLKDGLEVLMNLPSSSSGTVCNEKNEEVEEEGNRKSQELDLESTVIDYEAQMAVGIGYAHKALEITIQSPSFLSSNSMPASSAPSPFSASSSSASPSSSSSSSTLLSSSLKTGQSSTTSSSADGKDDKSTKKKNLVNGNNSKESMNYRNNKLEEHRAKVARKREEIQWQRFEERKALKGKYLNQAVAHLKAAIAARPCSIDPYLLLAEVLYSYDDELVQDNSRSRNSHKKIEEANLILDHAQELFFISGTSPCYISGESLGRKETLSASSSLNPSLFASKKTRRLYASLQLKISRFYLGTGNYQKVKEILLARVFSIDDQYPDAHADLMLVNFFLFTQARDNLQKNPLGEEEGGKEEERRKELVTEIDKLKSLMVQYKKSAIQLGYIPLDINMKEIMQEVDKLEEQ